MKKGIYVSYNESISGPFDEAAKMSRREYVIWKDDRILRHKFEYPAKIIIKISKKKKYYTGKLLLIRPYRDLKSNLFKNDVDHRPTKWRSDTRKVRWVFFISKLRKNKSKPKEVKNMPSPEGKLIIMTF